MSNNPQKPDVTDRSEAIDELVKKWVLKNRQAVVEDTVEKLQKPEQLPPNDAD